MVPGLWALVLGLSLLHAAAPAPEAARPLVRVYPLAETGADDDVRCAVQDAQGIMLFGTRGAVLEFDGSAWRRLNVPTSGAVHRLAATPDGSVWLAAEGEVGRFVPTRAGGRDYESLTGRLPAELRAKLDDTTGLAAHGAHVWLAAGGALLRWSGGAPGGFTAYPISGDTAPLQLFDLAARGVIARVPRGGVFQLASGDPVPFAHPPQGHQPFAWLSPLDDAGRWLLAPLGDSLRLRQGDTSELAPRPMRGSRLTAGAILADGGYAFGQLRGGIAVVDRNLRLRYTAAGSEGVPIEDIHAVYIDRAGGIWACAARGLARIDDRAGAFFFDARNGLAPLPPDADAIAAEAGRRGHTAPPDVLRHVYRVDEALFVQLAGGSVQTYDYGRARFIAVNELIAARASWPVPGGVLFDDGAGVKLWPGADQAIVPLAGGNCLGVAVSGEREFVFCTPTSFVRAQRHDDGWRATLIPHGVEGEIGRADPETADTWWLVGGTTSASSTARAEAGPPIFRLRLDGDRVIARDRFGTAEGLPPAQVLKLARVGDDWLAFTAHGLRHFDAAARRFTPFTRFGSSFADGSQRVDELVLDPAGRAWVIAAATRAERAPPIVLTVEQDGLVRELPRDIRLRLGRPAALQLDPGAAEGSVLWIAGYAAFARIELGRWPAAHALPVNLRGVRIVGGERLPLQRGGDATPITQGAHTLRFNYAAAHFPLSGTVEYQTRVEGLEGEWSDWQPTPVRELSNLPVGRYALHVRARHDGAIGEAPVHAFAIVPPWWRSPAAVTAWTLLTAGAAAGLVRWRVRVLRRQNERLGNLVATRTAELTASEEKLRIARDAAEAANRAKSAFLAHMSHELRTPLNGILGYTQILRRDPALSAGHRERLGIVADSGEHLLGLINEVLDLARIEAGKMELRAGDVSLARLARGVADLVRARCEEKNLRFELTLAAGLPRVVRTDELKLRQALLNLLGNAVKFTPGGRTAPLECGDLSPLLPGATCRSVPNEGATSRAEQSGDKSPHSKTDRAEPVTPGSSAGRVKFSIAPAPDGRVRFTVEDTGPGIAPDRLAQLFTLFDTTAANAAQGTGLGLALSQRMIELLGGRIHVSSTPGMGSRFWFDLPLPEVGSNEPFGGPANARIATSFRGAHRRLLIVDDEATNRTVLRELLAPLGFGIEEASEGGAALAAACAAPPDAVLLDLRFVGGPDGFAIARALRAEPRLAGLKIIAVSASVFESDRHEALAAGCDAFLAKPFREEQLFAVLGATLGLEWDYAEAPVPPAPSPPGPLPEAARAALFELSQRGDVLRLRKRLAELAAAPAHAAFARELDQLAATYQMKRIRDLLSDEKPLNYLTTKNAEGAK